MATVLVPSRPDYRRVFNEAFMAGLVALALTVTMVGLHTVSVQSRLVIEFRPADVAGAVALVFLGRLGIGLIREGLLIPVGSLAAAIALVGLFIPMPSDVLRVILVGGGAVLAIRSAWGLYDARGGAAAAEARAAKGTLMDRISAGVQAYTPQIALVAGIAALAFPMIVQERYWIDIAILVLTYIMLGWGLNIVVGLAGLLDLGYVAFYAVGAYSYALLSVHFGLSFWVCLPLAGVLAALAGLILGFPVLRLRGDYFAIVTLGFGEIIRIILLNWYNVTGGPDGINNIARPSFFGIAEFTPAPAEGQVAFHELFGLEFDGIHRVIFLYYLILILAIVVNIVSVRIRRLPIGRSWEALREDDIACQSLGINRRNIKLIAFTISAAFGGFAGSFFATRQGFISPESFTFLESAIVLAIVVLGGMGSQLGIVLAAILIIGLPEIFRELEQYRMLVFGMAMVGIMTWRPRGLLAHREPSVLLHGRKGRLRSLPDRPARPAAGELRS